MNKRNSLALRRKTEKLDKHNLMTIEEGETEWVDRFEYTCDQLKAFETDSIKYSPEEALIKKEEALMIQRIKEEIALRPKTKSIFADLLNGFNEAEAGLRHNLSASSIRSRIHFEIEDAIKKVSLKLKANC